MMEPVVRVEERSGNPCLGEVKFSFSKAFWNLGMLFLAVILCPFTFSVQAFWLFVVSTYFSLLIGHSVGMHRMMIHRTFETPKFIERLLIYAGVLVGMAGPLGIIKIHDTRDWAQRQPNCHSFFSHTKPYLQDLWWQLTSNFMFEIPPSLKIEERYSKDPFYKFLEKTWRWHQLVLGILLYLWGGWAFVVWGVFARVSLSIVGHWTITYFCHNPGPGIWRVKNASVQASNIPGLGIITYGECWHNNHHAFPESARIGLEKGQCDPSWRFIQILRLLGFASNIGKPRPPEEREDLYVSS